MFSTSFQLVAKSVRVNRFRLALIASICSIIVINATFLIHIVDELGRLVITGLVFIFASLPTFIMLLDTMSHSSQSIGVFQALGAKRYTVTTAVLVSLLGVGMVGAVAGAMLGLLLTNTYASLSPVSFATFGRVSATQLLLSTAYVLASCAAGIVTGVILGVRISWGKLS